MAPLILLYIVLAYLDFLYTRFMLLRHGVEIELNPLIRWLIPRVGLDLGVMIGIAVPTSVLIPLGIWFRPVLETVLFLRLMLFFLQARNLRKELWHLPNEINFN